MPVIIDGSSGVNISSTTGVINLLGSTSGVITLVANAVAGTNTLTLPNVTGTLAISAAPNVTTYTSGSGTYTVPTNTKYLTVEMVAGGGGSGGSTAAGGTGGTSSFNSITVIGGSGGSGGSPGVGGTGGSGTALLRVVGGSGGIGQGSGTTIGIGGSGGSTLLGAGNPIKINASISTQVPASAGQSYGGGASGAPGDLATYGSYAGGGGGEYARLLITSPSSTYSYAVGAGGTAGTGTPAGALAVNPVTNPVWPSQPTEQWSS